MHLVIIFNAAYPTGKDILDLERIVTELLGSSNRILLEIFQYLILQLWIYGNIFVPAGAVVDTRPCDRQRWRIPCRTYHLVDIPVGLDI